jgi:hypothetical protein
MTAGFQCWGDNGNFRQIDSNYRSLRMSQKSAVDTNQALWTSSTGQGGDGGIWYVGAVAVGGMYPIVAFRCNSYCFTFARYNSEGNWTWYFVTQGRAHVDFWVFNELPPVESSNIGMQIFKEDGRTLVFDSNDKAAKIFDYWVYTGAALNVGQNVIRNMGASTWAVCHVQTVSLTSIGNTPNGPLQNTMVYATSSIGSQFTLIALRPINGVPAVPGFPNQAAGFTSPSYLFLDVSGY